MAVVTLNGSRIMTGLEATPVALADPGEGGGIVRQWTETIETGAADSESSTYLMARLPSNARILGTSKIYWDDLGTSSATLDVGVYNLSGQTDITDDPDALSAGHDCSAAGSASLITGIANHGLALWDYATGTTDPKSQLDVKVVIEDNDLSAAGTITVEIHYTID